MKVLKFILTGVLFGIIMTKSEAVSWFRIQEMFRFHSFHMYGIIGSAVMLGIAIVAIIKRTKMKAIDGSQIKFTPKLPRYKSAILGGMIFGLGWALVGACPGPMYTLLGNGFIVILIPIASAILGTYVYGVVKNKLPH